MPGPSSQAASFQVPAAAPGTPYPGPGATPPYGPVPSAAFRPLAGLATAIVVLLAVNVLADTSVLIPVDPDAPLGATDVAAMLALLVYVLTSIALAVLTLVFFFRARKNLDVLGAEGLRWSPGWAIGSWFIPFANVVLVPMVVGETVKASARLRSPDPQVGFPGLVVAWWVVWLLYNAVGEAWGRVDYDSAANLPLAIANVALGVPAALLFGVVVRRVGRDQGEHAAGQARPPQAAFA